jgi:hypothetical protein
MSSAAAVPNLSRRRVFIGAAALAAAGLSASACTTDESPKTDELIAQRDLAVRDSQIASAAASAAGPFYAPLLNVVADERKMHANALSNEINRATGSTAAPSSFSPTPSTGTPPSRNDVISALRESAELATKLAAELSGYRAGLLGSIAASCTASATVSLTVKEPAR